MKPALGVPAERRVYRNRTLNLRGIRAVGFDMDYTLVHYHTGAWEQAAYECARGVLADRDWPVEDLRFDPTAHTQGLVFDLELGNICKATRFGYVVRAHHGSRPLTFEEQREAYAGIVVDLADPRFEFMNTLFSLSQAGLFAQLVDLADCGRLPGVPGYLNLWRSLASALDEAHTQGALKAQIMADPKRFVVPDPEVGQTLVDLHQAGKQLLLITNSDWVYSAAMMAYTIDPVLPGGMTWREVFDVVIVEAAKPKFFNTRNPAFVMEDEHAALYRPYRGLLEPGNVYLGGDAWLVERSLGLTGSEILYVGDHLFGDVHISKSMLRWRTGLVLRELEGEVAAQEAFRPTEEKLRDLMERKTTAEETIAALRLLRQRSRHGDESGPPPAAIETQLRSAAAAAARLDERIAPLAREAAERGNPHWGLLMRAGNDKSLFARQVEKYADVYTSRVSNFGAVSPFAYLRASRTSLPHD